MNNMTDPAQFWDEAHAVSWPVRVNPLLAEIAADLPPGHALDLGCGAGGDARWLAGRGWRVTAVDISATAIQRLAEAAPQVSALRMDLAEEFPEGDFDLVSAQYFHTPFALPRSRVLRRAAHALRPGGRLVVVDHGSTAPWSWVQDPDLHYPTPDEVAAELALDPRHWRIERADTPQRLAHGPDGQTATVVDNVLVIRRVGA
ncbi:class I SAM-dependent methyltransferase [Pseudonocardiaceae bacterium YIM PH 21723]|nr:class I SAM-dependent methyltransferase [Pseudonocardiaceae bacterium YIM PH 21723]